jgi:hypothetical protein
MILLVWKKEEKVTEERETEEKEMEVQEKETETEKGAEKKEKFFLTKSLIYQGLETLPIQNNSLGT